jgi:hypothetical protein
MGRGCFCLCSQTAGNTGGLNIVIRARKSCQQQREYKPDTKPMFCKRVKKVLMDSINDARPTINERKRLWVVSPLSQCRQRFKEYLNIPEYTWYTEPLP